MTTKKRFARAPSASRIDRLWSDENTRWLCVAAVVLLVFALAAAFFIQAPVDQNIIVNWYLSYDHGYIHRGLIGGVLKLLYGGSPPLDAMMRIIPRADYAALFFNIVFLWALLTFLILSGRFSARAKWMLLAFTALLLTAPIWKTLALNIGYMDKWVFLFALLALAAIVFRRPALFAIFCVLGIMTHRGMGAYFPSLTLMVLFAVWRMPEFRSQAKRWIVAAAVPFAAFFLLSWANDAERGLLVLAESSDSQSVNNSAVVGNKSLSSLIALLTSSWRIFPGSAFFGFLFFGLPPLLAALLFALGCKMAGLKLGDDATSGGRFARIASHGGLLLPFVAAAGPLPMHFVAHDWSRLFYWSWIGLALGVVYWIRFSRQEQRKQKKSKRKNEKPALRRETGVAALTLSAAFCAWVFGGMPLISSHLTRPAKVDCRRWCVAGATENFVGKWAAESMHRVLLAAPFPFDADAAHLSALFRYRVSILEPLANVDVPHFFDPYIQGADLVKIEDEAIVVPSDYRYSLAPNFFLLSQGQNFVFKAKHQSAGIPPLELRLNGQSLSPQTADADESTWSYTLPQTAFYDFDLRSTGGAEFTLWGVSMATPSSITPK